MRSIVRIAFHFLSLFIIILFVAVAQNLSLSFSLPFKIQLLSQILFVFFSGCNKMNYLSSFWLVAAFLFIPFWRREKTLILLVIPWSYDSYRTVLSFSVKNGNFCILFPEKFSYLTARWRSFRRFFLLFRSVTISVQTKWQKNVITIFIPIICIKNQV